MRSEYRAMTDMLASLDPASNGAVTNLNLHLRNGEIWFTDDVTVDRGLVFARGAHNATEILCVPVEEICGVQLSLKPQVCQKEGISLTFPAIAAYGAN